jgi:hypothetical protein
MGVAREHIAATSTPVHHVVPSPLRVRSVLPSHPRTTASALIEELCVAADRGHFQEVLKRYVAPGVLVVDEVGYLTLRDNAANVLYHVVNKRYLKRKPIIFTTNKPLTEWGRVLHDDDLAEAILDRVLHNGRLIILDGPSVRNPPTSPSPSPEDDRISGNFATELTEPTQGSARPSRW